eukprot:scaffold32434_cov39-Cyclotella_meneghiniana.AAC.1
MSNSPHSPLPKHALSYSKVVKKFSPNSYSSEDTMDRIIAKKTDEPEDDDTDSTESAVIKERLIKQRQLNKQKKEIVIDDSSVESLTPSVDQAGTDDHNTAAVEEEDDASAWESVEEEHHKSADAVDASSAPSPAQETKKSTSKNQQSIKNLFQKQHQLNKASKPVSAPTQVKVDNYHFDPDDHITALLEDIHQEIAVLLCKAYEVANSFSLHPREGPFQVNYHVNDNEMWVVNKDNVGVLKVPDELWVEKFEGESEFDKIDEDPPSPVSSHNSQSSPNARQRRKERRAKERRLAEASKTSPSTEAAVKDRQVQNEVDSIIAARERFALNPPQFDEPSFGSDGVRIAGYKIAYNDETLKKATPAELGLHQLLEWPAPDPKHPTMYRISIENYDGELPLKSDSRIGYYDAIVSALYWHEYVRRGLSDPSRPSPSEQRPFHYKPFDFPFYDLQAPINLGLTTTQHLVEFLTGQVDGDDSQDSSVSTVTETGGVDTEKAAPAGALKKSSYGAPRVNESVPKSQLQRILESSAQPSTGPERNHTGESCLLTMWVDPVEGLHPTECLVERSQHILTTGLKIDLDFKLLPMYEEVQKQKKLKPVSKVDKNFPITTGSIIDYLHVPNQWQLRKVKDNETYADGRPKSQPTIMAIMRIQSAYSNDTMVRYLLPELDLQGVSISMKGVQLPDTETKQALFGLHPDSCPAGLQTMLLQVYKIEIRAMVKEKKLTKIEAGTIVLDDIFLKRQGIKSVKLVSPSDVSSLGIDGVANYWKRAIAVETPTN